MFESFREPPLSDRLRVAAFVPLAAFVIAIGSSDIQQLIPRSARLVDALVRAALAAGCSAGALLFVDAIWTRRETFDVRSIVWLMLYMVSTILAASTLVTLIRFG